FERRFAFLLVIGSALAVAGWWWWSATGRADINFLPSRAPAHWILYPFPPDAMGHRNLELATTFKTSFSLTKVPTQSQLEIAGFHRYAVSLNHRLVEEAKAPSTNWKHPTQLEVSRYLLPGTNEIHVTVYNTNGPPALWLCLHADDLTLPTDQH